MFSTYSGGSPSAEGLESGQYVGKLMRLEPFQSEFLDDRGNPKQRIKWIWHIAHADNPRQPLLGGDGEPYEFWSYSGTATGEKSTAGPWLRALLGRPVQPGEDGDALAQAVIGRAGTLWIKVETVAGEQGGLDRTTSKLLSVDPYKAGAAAPKPQPVAVATAPARVKAATAVAVAEPDDDAIPF